MIGMISRTYQDSSSYPGLAETVSAVTPAVLLTLAMAPSLSRHYRMSRHYRNSQKPMSGGSCEAIPRHDDRQVPCRIDVRNREFNVKNLLLQSKLAELVPATSRNRFSIV
jgi:hypothetical protein